MTLPSTVAPSTPSRSSSSAPRTTTSDVREAYDGEWVELVSFPEDAVHWIIRDGEDVDDG